MNKSKKILLAVCGIILVIAGTVMIILSVTENTKMKKDLVRYGYSSGGDMQGSHYSEEIRKYDDTHALMIISSAEWYYDDDKVEEYLIDVNVLKEIGNIFRENHMNRWNGRKLSNVFVADGATYSYSFSFGDNEYGFYSQSFPVTYANKLKKIDEAINKYSADKERLPGLVLPEKTEDEDGYKNGQPVEGELTFEVFGYKDSEILCRLLNGTEEKVVFKADLRLFNADTNEEIAVTNSKYASDYDVNPGESEEKSTTVNSRLAPGRYRLESGELSAEFEIA